MNVRIRFIESIRETKDTERGEHIKIQTKKYFNRGMQ